MAPRPYQHIPRTPIRVSTPRLPPCYAYGTCAGGPHSMTYRIEQNPHSCCHHNYGIDMYPPSTCGTIRSSVRCAPPNFKPPPPPAYRPEESLRSPVPSSSSTKPPSDDSAYSEEGSFMHSHQQRENSGSSSSGTLLLRMDLSKNPPVFYEGH
uniref:Uncharacterized protein n=1 Tax=Acrobeloides nanus TaxID=290746 RepID=A0A914DYX1_9BILA